ncbi:MAG TPA: hypothetical protein VN088_11340 [Nocardioides sp.]|nr:hypothetical protein [Nocardioides sp.]
MTTAGLRSRTGRWYVTSPATNQRYVAGELVTMPVAIAHAKEMGTDRTACGLWSYSWRGMLEISFPMGPGTAPEVEMCATCVGQVARKH